MGEDQDAFGARGLDEAGGGDRLAGGGRVAEAEAARRARVGRDDLDLLVVRLDVLALRELVVDSSSSSTSSATASSPLPLPFSPASGAAAISSVSMPVSASTWWRRSSVPEARRGGFSESTRSSPSMSA